MNTLSIYSIALLLAVGTSVALASPDYGKRGHDGARHQDGARHHDRARHRSARQRHDWRPQHRGGLRFALPARRHHNGYWYSPRYQRHNYFPSYLGAALIGSALTHSFYHMHNGAVCYDRHDNDYNNYSNPRSYEVVGCHRIERYEDGTERRVEAPMSECN